MKTCSFFGHRDTEPTEELKQKVRETVERLIVEEEVDNFVFGSRSNFDELCHLVVTELQENYPHICRIAYLCKHEGGCFVGEGEEEAQFIKAHFGKDVYVREFEDIKRSDRVNSAGRAAYVERNQWMIDDSEFVVFHLDFTSRQSTKRSGTMIAYQYAQRQSKIIELL